ncbi:hypothetical protein [Streptomyces omiyaensis]|uniref:hypothetical protein n=1 Tax=Streptomyces omiyaensis TaxID=68247 RepID=UPI0036FE0399
MDRQTDITAVRRAMALAARGPGAPLPVPVAGRVVTDASGPHPAVRRAVGTKAAAAGPGARVPDGAAPTPISAGDAETAPPEAVRPRGPATGGPSAPVLQGADPTAPVLPGAGPTAPARAGITLPADALRLDAGETAPIGPDPRTTAVPTPKGA